MEKFESLDTFLKVVFAEAKKKKEAFIELKAFSEQTSERGEKQR